MDCLGELTHGRRHERRIARRPPDKAFQVPGNELSRDPRLSLAQ